MTEFIRGFFERVTGAFATVGDLRVLGYLYVSSTLGMIPGSKKPVDLSSGKFIIGFTKFS
jgi:hypothetical protein